MSLAWPVCETISVAYQLQDLLYLMSRLRDPEDGCPWDREQTMASVVPHTLEECYELIDAIECGDLNHTRDELGDLLFQVVFYTQIGAESGAFDFASVVDALVAKLLRRHPHVFPQGQLRARVSSVVDDVDQVHQRWEEIKQQERQSQDQHSVLDDVPLALPAVLRASKLQRRVARVGFDWDNVGEVIGKLEEELAELRQAIEQEDPAAQAAEFGDLLFSVVNVARHLEIEPESALRGTNRRFEQRFRLMEKMAVQRGLDMDSMSPAELDVLWETAKRELATPT